MTEAEMIQMLIDSTSQWIPPTLAELAAAPLLDEWALQDVGDDDNLPAAVGIVTGHPFVSDGDVLLADECFAMAPGMTWVRTISRLYRLGRRANGGRDAH